MVSGRRSLYRQSTGRGASHSNDLAETVVHWERVWVSPLPVSTSNGNPNAKVNGSAGVSKTLSGTTSGGNSLEEDQSPAQATLPFKVKVWAQLDNQGDFATLNDGDDDDYINLVAATSHVQGRKVNAVNQATSDSLTAADIRGAVGGGEDVSISSYTSNEAKPKSNATSLSNVAAPTITGQSDISVAQKASPVQPAQESTENPIDLPSTESISESSNASNEPTVEIPIPTLSVEQSIPDERGLKPVTVEEPQELTERSQAEDPDTRVADVDVNDSSVPLDTQESKLDESSKPQTASENSTAERTTENANDFDTEMKDC